MRRTLLGAVALAIVLPATPLSTGPAPAAPGPSAAQLTISGGIGGFVVDDAHQRVFVGDRTAGTVQAADFTGTVVDSTNAVPGVRDLALAPDGSVLYASSWDAHQVVALDPATLDVVARYTVATTYGPSSVAVAGGKVWFSYGDQWDGNLGSIAPASGTVTMNQYPRRVWGQALLDTAAGRPDLLAVGETGISTDSMAVLDTSGAAPREVAFYQGDYTLNSGISDIDLVPGADQVLVNGRERQAWAESRFTSSGAYPGGTRADISTDGFVATVAADGIRVYGPDEAVARTTLTTDAPARELAWAGDGSRLFALTSRDPFSGPSSLVVLEGPLLAASTLTVSAPATAQRGRPLRVSGTLSSAVAFEGAPVLVVRRIDVDHPAGLALPSPTVGADGAWSVDDVPSAGGTVTYAVSYAGDDLHAAASASAQVAVPRRAVQLTLQAGAGKVYAGGSRLVVTAHLGPTARNRRVELWATPVGAARPVLLRGANVDRSGNVRASVVLRRNTTIAAVYAGDALTSSRTVSVTTQVRTTVSLTSSGHYRVGRSGAVTYHYFHDGVEPVVTIRMGAFPGRSARLDVEQFVDGRWQALAQEFFELDELGRIAVLLPAGYPGVKARVRAAYVKRASGDAANATTYGSWVYLAFTK